MPDERSAGGHEDGYTDREMRLIFERAGQLDIEAGSERRFSLAELREMGAQAGLNPADITKAAVALRSEPARRGMLGAPTRFTAVGYASHHLEDAEVAEIVLRIREATGLHGELRTVPGGMEWRARSALGVAIVDFSPTGQGTRVDVLIGREDLAAVTVIGAGFAGVAVGVAAGLITGIALHGNAGVGIGVGAVATTGVAWSGARLVWSRIAGRVALKTSALMGAITDTIETGTVNRRPPE